MSSQVDWYRFLCPRFPFSGDKTVSLPPGLEGEGTPFTEGIYPLLSEKRGGQSDILASVTEKESFR